MCVVGESLLPFPYGPWVLSLFTVPSHVHPCLGCPSASFLANSYSASKTLFG